MEINILGALNKSEYGNCEWDDSTEIIIHDPSTEVSVQKIQKEYGLDDQTETNFDFTTHSKFLEYRDSVIIYIGGYIQRKLLARSDCVDCDNVLKSSSISSSLINRKDRGGLIRPNDDIIRIIKLSDNILNERVKTSDIFSELNLLKKLSIQAVTAVSSQFPNVFNDIGNHDPLVSHRTNMIKEIIQMYLSLKINHFCRLKNIDKNSFSRHISKKIPLFKHE